MFAALGILLIVAGAILTFAVNSAVDGVDLAAIGWIMMIGGGIALLIAAIQGIGWMSMSKTKVHTERHVTDDGQHYVEETRSA